MNNIIPEDKPYKRGDGALLFCLWIFGAVVKWVGASMFVLFIIAMLITLVRIVIDPSLLLSAGDY